MQWAVVATGSQVATAQGLWRIFIFICLFSWPWTDQSVWNAFSYRTETVNIYVNFVLFLWCHLRKKVCPLRTLYDGDYRQSMSSFFSVFSCWPDAASPKLLQIPFTCSGLHPFLFHVLFISVLLTMQCRTTGANWHIWPPLIATIFFFCVALWRNMEQSPLEENWQRASLHCRRLIGELTRLTERRSLSWNSSRSLSEDIMWPTPAWRTQGTVYKRRSCQVEDTGCSAL